MNANQSVPSGADGQPPAYPGGPIYPQVPPQNSGMPVSNQSASGFPPPQPGYSTQPQGYPPQQPGYPPPGYSSIYAPPPQKKKRAWIPFLIGGLVLLAVAFTFLALEGILPARPELTFSVTTHDFGEQFINRDTEGKTIEIINSGHGLLIITSILLEDEENYALKDDQCSGKSLSRDESCSFTIAFVPQSSGSKSSGVEVTSNAKTSPDSIMFDGKAVIPPCNIAILGAAETDWMDDINIKLDGTGFFDSVDTFDVSGSTLPTLDDLKEFSSVMVFSDASFGNASGLGDLLADYIDAGGGVVVTTFAFNDNYENELVGRIYNDDYLPFSVGPQNYNDMLTMEVDIPDHPIMLDVNSFNGGSSSYHNEISLANSATLIAHWSNGVPLIAVLEVGDGRIAGLNFYPVSDNIRSDLWDTSTDGALLMANAMAWAGRCYTGE